jgi:hypothetical protein
MALGPVGGRWIPVKKARESGYPLAEAMRKTYAALKKSC